MERPSERNDPMPGIARALFGASSRHVPRKSERRIDPNGIRERHPAALAFANRFIDANTIQIPLEVDPEVSLQRRRSTLADTDFSPEQADGLFAQSPIERGTVIMSVPSPLCQLINDPMVDLRPVLRAVTAEAMEEALVTLIEGYYDDAVAVERVNTFVAVSPFQGAFCCALKDIPEGGELLRAYGASMWIGEALSFLTLANAGGFVAALRRIAPALESDPCRHWILDWQERVEGAIRARVDLSAADMESGRVYDAALAKREGLPPGPLLNIRRA